MKSALSITSIAHLFLKNTLEEGALAVDATAGNGHDTLFLARCCGASGQVYAFDVQPQAVQNTLARLQQAREQRESLAPCHVWQASHARMGAMLPEEWRGQTSAIIFNLGYLPGGDKSLVTLPESTLAALEAAAAFLRPNGLLSVAVYPGHPGGDHEAAQILAWVKGLDTHRWEALRVGSLQRADVPFLILLRRSS